jgi:hypothetical protein
VNTVAEKPLNAELNQKTNLQQSQVEPKKSADKASLQAAVDLKPAKKKASKKVQEKTLSDLPPEFTQNSENVKQPKPATKTAEVTPKSSASISAQAEKSNQKSGWKNFTDSLQQGQERGCTQAEITMNQCHQ